MKKTPFILYETFRSENERQRRESFQQACGILWVGDYTERKGVNDESSYLLPFEQGG